MSKYEPPIQWAPEQRQTGGDDIDLRELIVTLWRGKWIVSVFIVGAAVAGALFAFSKPNVYEASVLLAPAQDSSSTRGLSSQLGGLASLAGIDLSEGGTNQTLLALEILKSRAFLTAFIQRHDLSVQLMASEEWNIKSQSWVIDENLYNSQTREWRKNEDGSSLKPTEWDMVKRFREDHLSISSVPETGLVSLRVKSESPQTAQDWAEKLVHDINEYLRGKDVQQAEARIAFLEEKLNETNVTGMQQILFQLIENETRTVMLANAQNEYVFETVDPAVVPQEHSAPQRALIVIVAVLLGGMLGVLVVFARAVIQTEKKVKVNV